MNSSSDDEIAGNLMTSSSAFSRKVRMGIRHDSKFFLRNGDDCYTTVLIGVAHQGVRTYCHSIEWQISRQHPQVEGNGRLKLIDGCGER